MTILACNIGSGVSITPTMRSSEHTRTLIRMTSSGIAEYRVTLNTDVKLDQHTRNMPITSEVTDVWAEGNKPCMKCNRSVTLFGNDNTRYSIKPHFGCYAPCRTLSSSQEVSSDGIPRSQSTAFPFPRYCSPNPTIIKTQVSHLIYIHWLLLLLELILSMLSSFQEIE